MDGVDYVDDIRPSMRRLLVHVLYSNNPSSTAKKPSISSRYLGRNKQIISLGIQTQGLARKVPLHRKDIYSA